MFGCFRFRWLQEETRQDQSAVLRIIKYAGSTSALGSTSAWAINSQRLSECFGNPPICCFCISRWPLSLWQRQDIGLGHFSDTVTSGSFVLDQDWKFGYLGSPFQVFFLIPFCFKIEIIFFPWSFAFWLVYFHLCSECVLANERGSRAVVTSRSSVPLCAKCCLHTSLKFAELNLNLASLALSAGRGEVGRITTSKQYIAVPTRMLLCNFFFLS